jgi:hypothetical protein
MGTQTPLVVLARLHLLSDGDGQPRKRGGRPAGPDPIKGLRQILQDIGHLCQSSHSRVHLRESGLVVAKGAAQAQKEQHQYEQMQKLHRRGLHQ